MKVKLSEFCEWIDDILVYLEAHINILFCNKEIGTEK